MTKSIKTLATLSLICSAVVGNTQNIGINSTGATPDPSAMLDIVSTDKGILIPRVSSGQRTSISSPATGLMVYDTTTGSFWYFNGTVWVENTNENTDNDGIYGGDGTTPSGTDVTITDYINWDANTLYMDGTNNRIGIKNVTPSYDLDITGSSRTTVNHYFGTSGAFLSGGNQGGSIELGPTNSGGGEVPFIDFHYGIGAAEDYNFRLINIGNDRLDFTNTLGTTMTVNGSNVGIGTTGPSQKLHVVGNELVSGDIYVSAANYSGLHYGSTGLYGSAASYSFDAGNTGLVIEGTNNGSESGGIFMNGNTMVLWSPGDNDILKIMDEDAMGTSQVTVQSDGDLKMEGNNSIIMPNNIVYSQTTTDIGAGSSYVTLRSATITVEAGQKVLIMAWANMDHDDEEVIYFQLLRGATQLGEIVTFEEDDQTGSWTDDFVGQYTWVDEPAAGTYTYYINFRGDDGSGLTAYRSSLVLIKF